MADGLSERQVREVKIVEGHSLSVDTAVVEAVHNWRFESLGRQRVKRQRKRPIMALGTNRDRNFFYTWNILWPKNPRWVGPR